ncbi:MAG: hypothetical protein ACLR5Y_04615 [Haemophilus parainfluenzae]
MTLTLNNGTNAFPNQRKTPEELTALSQKQAELRQISRNRQAFPCEMMEVVELKCRRVLK